MSHYDRFYRDDVVPLEVECRATVKEFYREAVRKSVRVRSPRCQ